MKAEPKTILYFLHNYFEAIRELFEVQSKEGFIKRERLQQVLREHQMNIEQQLHEYKILKKVGEEAAETIIAAKNANDAANDPESRKPLSAEISDLLYHLLVLMVEREVSLQDILNELSHRAGKPANPKYSK